MTLIKRNLNNPGSFVIKIMEENSLKKSDRSEMCVKDDDFSQMAILMDYAFESFGLGIWCFDFETKVLKICKRCQKIIDIPETQLRDVDQLLDLLPKDRIPAILSAISAANEKSQPLNIQFPTINKSQTTGQAKWFRITGILGDELNGNTKKLYGTLTDISIVMNEEINRQDLMALFSHEMKSPLSSIKLYVQLCYSIALKTADFRISEFLNSANEMIDKADKMVDYFLKGPTMETGRLNLVITEFNMEDLLTTIVAEVQFKYPEHQIILQTVPGIIVHADRERIGQVVQNLLTNASKYSPVPNAIIISCRILQDNLQVSVEDQGIGIAKNEHHKIFDKYYRVNNKLDKAIAGYGIGLYLCKNIIDEHRGQIWFESEENKGSTFLFRLPLS